MHEAHTIVQTRCLELEAELSKLRAKVQKDDHTELVKCFSNLEITRAKHIEQTTALLTENENLKAQIHENLKCITIDSVKPKVLAPGRYAIDVEPIPPHNRNNREVHLDYLKHLKESVETLREIVNEAKVDRPLDFNKRDEKHATTHFTRKKQVTFEDQCETSNNNAHKHVEKLNIQKTNVHVRPSTGVNSCNDASESQPRSNTKKNRISPAKSVNKKKVEERPRTNRPTERIFTLGEQCPLTRLTKSKVVPAKQTDNVSTSKTVITEKLRHTSQKQLTRYQRKNQQYQAVLVSLPTSPENQAIAASMQSAIAYANQQEPNQN
ncbi:hypothetical protein Tco_0987679 [Tanacetum coccineum]